MAKTITLRDRVEAVGNNDLFQTALWIGGSAAIMAVVSYLLQKPELAEWYGVLNFILYAVKYINDSRKK